MKTIIVDDEVLALEQFSIQCETIDIIDIVGKFESPYDAIEFTKSNSIQLAVLDIEVPGLSGLELLTELRKIHPNLIVIIATGYSQYALDAFKAHAVGFLLKPYCRDDLLYAIETATLHLNGQSKGVYIRTFGRFEVFLNEEIVFFRNSKSKELLALLVDMQGGSITTEFGISKLWEERPYDNKTQSLYRKAAKQLKDTLKEKGIEEIIISNKSSRCLNTKKVKCDYYEYLENGIHGKDKFNHEYMSNYLWAEETLATLL